jgi:hypothetical protein
MQGGLRETKSTGLLLVHARAGFKQVRVWSTDAHRVADVGRHRGDAGWSGSRLLGSEVGVRVMPTLVFGCWGSAACVHRRWGGCTRGHRVGWVEHRFDFWSEDCSATVKAQQGRIPTGSCLGGGESARSARGSLWLFGARHGYLREHLVLYLWL